MNYRSNFIRFKGSKKRFSIKYRVKQSIIIYKVFESLLPDRFNTMNYHLTIFEANPFLIGYDEHRSLIFTKLFPTKIIIRNQ